MTDGLVARKARGAFFTPPEISKFLTDWAIRSGKDLVLEPACGEARFLIEAGNRLRELGGGHKTSGGTQLRGVEIHASSAERAVNILGEHGVDAQISVADFFDIPAEPMYDAVIGNPPFVRYHQFAGNSRSKGLQAAFAQGVRLSGLASSWAPFVVHGARFLKPNGRLALVLPAELLAVNYAAPVRRFLLDRFKFVRLVLFEKRVFPDVLEEVILLLAEGSGGAKNFEIYQARDVEDLDQICPSQWTNYAPTEGDKWTPALLSAPALSLYEGLTTSEFFEPLQSWGETYLGAVTGNNDFFCLSRSKAQELQLKDEELLRISPPGSRHLKGFKFSEASWASLAEEGARCYLFYPDSDKLSTAARRYIAGGEKNQVQAGYKCTNRKPWWRVPLVAIPDLLFTYMNNERPRLIENDADVWILNSIYGVFLKRRRKQLGRNFLPISSLNSVTLLGAEVVGRAYGGGLLKMEPKEADLLPMPAEALLRAAGDDLRLLRPQLATHLRQGDLEKVVELVDEVLLVRNAKVGLAELNALRRGREFLFERRRSRGRRGAN